MTDVTGISKSTSHLTEKKATLFPAQQPRLPIFATFYAQLLSLRRFVLSQHIPRSNNKKSLTESRFFGSPLSTSQTQFNGPWAVLIIPTPPPGIVYIFSHALSPQHQKILATMAAATTETPTFKLVLVGDGGTGKVCWFFFSVSISD